VGNGGTLEEIEREGRGKGMCDCKCEF